MKAKDMRTTAQVVTLPKLGQIAPIPFNENGTSSEGDSMKKQHLSIDCYRKLHRSQVLSSHIFTDLARREISGLHQLYIPYIFSYLSDDISDINEELKEKGLFDEWLRQERTNFNKE